MSIITSPAFVNAMSDMVADRLIKDALDDRWWAFSKSAAKQEAKFISALVTLFAAQEKEVLRNLNRKPLPEANARDYVKALFYTDVRIKAAGDEWLFEQAKWEANFEKSGKPIILGSLVEGGETALADLGLAVNFNRTSPAVLEFIAKKVPKFSFDVNQTTLDQLRREFKAALELGEGIPLITKRVEKVFGFPEKFRNKRIAQTEIIGSMNKGGHEGMRQSDVVKEKVWISTRDALTRDSHLAIDGEHVLLERRYSNGLMYPGDYTGAAAEMINCRCTDAAFSFKE